MGGFLNLKNQQRGLNGMEYFDLFSEEGHPLNKVAMRGAPLSPGEFFKVVHVWIQHPDGKYLIQQRNKTSDPIPHQWAITSGIPNIKETPVEAAIRETKEELGIQIDKAAIQFKARLLTTHGKYNTITYVYHVKQAFNLSEINVLDSEVKAVRYETMETILSMVEAELFWDYRSLLHIPEYFDLIAQDSL